MYPDKIFLIGLGINLCKPVFIIDKGELRGKGTYDKLIKENTFFQAAAKNL